MEDKKVDEKVQFSFLKLINPAMLLVIGFLVKDKLENISDDLKDLKAWAQMSGSNIIELKESRKALEHRLEAIEKKIGFYPAKHEDETDYASIK